MRRTVIVLAVALASLGLVAPAAWALPSLSLSKNSGPPGTATTVTGSSFTPGYAVDIYVDTGFVATAVANASGAISIGVTVPASAVPGTHWVTARQTDGLAAQKAFTVVTTFAAFRGEPRHRGYNRYENVLDPTTVAGLDTDWTYPAPVNGQPAVSTRLVFGVPVATVYVGAADGNVYALNAATGALVWSYTTGANVYSSPAVANGTLYVGSQDGKVYALNATTGALVWSYTTGDIVVSSPAVANGTVYVGSDDGNVYALNAATGALVWSHPTAHGTVASPAVANGTVYIGSYLDSKVYALNAATGALVWSYTTGNSVSSSPAVANGTVYVGSYDGNVYALNAATGALVWSYTTGSAVSSSPAVAKGIVYIGSFDSKVYALNAATGARLWSATTGNIVVSSPAVANGTVYVGSFDGKVRAYDLTDAPAAPARPDPATLRRSG